MGADWNYRLARTPYFVLPRLAIEAMPQDWQDRFEQLMVEADATGMETPAYYVHRDKAEPDCDSFMLGLVDVSQDPLKQFLRFNGRYGMSDPWANYRHGKIAELCPGFDPNRKEVPDDIPA